MNTVRAIAGLGTMTALLALGWLTANPADPPGPAADPPAGGQATMVGQAVGTGGCSGIACHGGDLPKARNFPNSGWSGKLDPMRWTYSDTLFRFYDPHTKAYDVLKEVRSIEIQDRLNRSLRAHENPVCLACHSNPTLANTSNRSLISQGVTCEACHGNAGGWIADHAGWPNGPGHSARYAPSGMTPLSDPVVRATTCAGCHVGAPAGDGAAQRDMNHDLIAAGHPRLNFDYGTYLRSLPPHWVEKDRNQSPPVLKPASDEFTHWLVGRAATAAASYRLLADRAKRQPWPELAEFDCYACHHGLTGARKDPLGARPGALVWNEPFLGPLVGVPELDSLRTAFDRPMDADAIRHQAEHVAKRVSEKAEGFKTTPLMPGDVAKLLADAKPRRWDEACHLYYAVAAIDRATDLDRKRPEDPKLVRVRAALRLPRDSDGARFNSPKDFDPAALRFPELFKARSGHFISEGATPRKRPGK